MEPFIGQINLFAGNFTPKGWAFCDRSSLQMEQSEALFATGNALALHGEGVLSYSISATETMVADAVETRVNVDVNAIGGGGAHEQWPPQPVLHPTSFIGWKFGDLQPMI